MSPEQAAGDREIDGRSDLYSLGIVAYQMLAGELPFKATSTPAMLMKHISERPAPIQQRRPDVPPDLATIVMRLLEKEPSRRFSDASAMVAALRGDTTQLGVAPGEPVPYPEEYAGGTERSSVPARAYETAREADYRTPTPDDIARWSSPEVQRFRTAFAKYAAVNSVILVASLFVNTPFEMITVIWSMVMAARYSRLWSTGYDWRDVFRQPRDRRLVDVATETVDDVRGIFGQQPRTPRTPRRPVLPPGASGPRDSRAVPQVGRYTDALRQAENDRGEILRLVASLPASDRTLVGDIVPAAESLHQRIQSLSIALFELERSDAASSAEQLERQITELEAQANPLDTRASEDRVRRLALLKRQRRALADTTRRRQEAERKLESCVLALQNMRLDVLRLRAGSVSSAMEHLTTLTERARALADDVDAAVYAADEVRKIGNRDEGSGKRRTLGG